MPCVGTPKSTAGVATSEFAIISTDHPLTLAADILPAYFGQEGGKLFLQAKRALHVTLVDGDGTRRPIPLGGGNCAYVTLSPGDRSAPFRLEARTAAGGLQVIHPGDWSGFPTDRA